jgi:hypothetical protein
MPPELAGCHPLWISLPFLEESQYAGGYLECGSAVFTSLYIDVEWLDLQALRRILVLARDGLPVCLKREPSQPGRVKHPDFDEVLAELISLPNVSDDFARVAVNPPLVEGEDLPEFFCRVVGDELLIFFAHPLSKSVSYPLRYGQSFCETSSELPVKLNFKGRSVEVTLTFEPCQSLLLRLGPGMNPAFEDIRFTPRTPQTS